MSANRFFMLFVMAFVCRTTLFAQNFTSKNVSVNPMVDGTLLLPNENRQAPLAILIADYGPVDRDGNQNFSNNNALKKLAEALAVDGIASYRYDKRTFKLNRQRQPVNNTLFDDFVSDADAVIEHFSDIEQFKDIYIIGHGQGSLVGMLATNEHISGLISIGGSAQSIDDTIIEQVTSMDDQLGKQAARIVADIKSGQTVSDIPQPLMSVFNKDVQKFMASWMQYDPKQVIAELTIPILIINGFKDLQVSIEEAELLKTSNKKVQLTVIDGMNHVFFKIDGDDLENSKSYNEPFRTISEELVEAIQNFIKL